MTLEKVTKQLEKYGNTKGGTDQDYTEKQGRIAG